MTEKRVKAAVNQAVYYRNYRRVRDRALTRLASAYPDDYKELLEQEKANEQEGEGDIGIAIGIGVTAVGIRSTATDQHYTEAGNHGKNQGYDGGEE